MHARALQAVRHSLTRGNARWPDALGAIRDHLGNVGIRPGDPGIIKLLTCLANTLPAFLKVPEARAKPRVQIALNAIKNLLESEAA